MISNLIIQESTAAGISAVVIGREPYGFAAACRFDTWVSSEDTVIRWSPTVAAAPACTGEQAASSAHRPRPAPRTATRRPLLANRPLRDTDIPLPAVISRGDDPPYPPVRA